MRVAVTGGTGFLGGHVITKLLAQGDEVIAIGRNESRGRELERLGAHFVKADLSERLAHEQAFAGCDAVVHCAALSSPWGSKQQFAEANVLGTQAVLDAIRHAQVRRLVHISTPSVYFTYRDHYGIREEDPLPKKGVNAYATTKLEAEQLVLHATKEHGLETVLLRPRGLFGPGDTVLLPRLLAANEKRGIPIMRKTPFYLDVTYVENVADAVLLSLKASEQCLGEVFNITNGESVEFSKLLEALFTALDKPFRPFSLPFPLAYSLAWLSEGIGHLTGQEPTLTRYGIGILSCGMTLDINKAKRLLGYEPAVSVEEGIHRFAQWWRAQHG